MTLGVQAIQQQGREVFPAQLGQGARIVEAAQQPLQGAAEFLQLARMHHQLGQGALLQLGDGIAEQFLDRGAEVVEHQLASVVKMTSLMLSASCR